MLMFQELSYISSSSVMFTVRLKSKLVLLANPAQVNVTCVSLLKLVLRFFTALTFKAVFVTVGTNGRQ